MLTSKCLMSSGGVRPGGVLETSFWISSLMEYWICENREVETDGTVIPFLEDRCQEEHANILRICSRRANVRDWALLKKSLGSIWGHQKFLNWLWYYFLLKGDEDVLAKTWKYFVWRWKGDAGVLAKTWKYFVWRWDFRPHGPILPPVDCLWWAAMVLLPISMQPIISPPVISVTTTRPESWCRSDR